MGSLQPHFVSRDLIHYDYIGSGSGQVIAALDPDPIGQVITDPDPTGKVITDPDPTG